MLGTLYALLSEASKMDSSLIQTLVGSLGPTGLLGWFLWYQTAVRDPRKDKDLRESYEKLQAAHSVAVSKMLDDEREFRKQEMALLRQSFQCKYNNG